MPPSCPPCHFRNDCFFVRIQKPCVARLGPGVRDHPETVQRESGHPRVDTAKPSGRDVRHAQIAVVTGIVTLHRLLCGGNRNRIRVVAGVSELGMAQRSVQRRSGDVAAAQLLRAGVRVPGQGGPV